jgi:UDP-N-acetylglucosamine acyltransferase
MPDISPHAIVEPGAELADDVRVGPFSYVGPRVRIGPRCVIANNVTLVGRTTLGERNTVFPLAVIGVPAQPGGDGGACTIGPGNAVREHVTIYAGRQRPTTIGADNLLMIYATVGAQAALGDHCILANATHVGPDACLEDYTHTSGFTTIGPSVRVGAYSFLAGYADIARDVPPYAMVQGTPCRVRGVNTHKLRRCGFADDDIRALKEAFRELYNGQEDAPNPTVVARLAAEEGANGHVRRLVAALAGGGAA